MSVRIEIRQTRTVEDGPAYRVKTEVEYVEGIASGIFVFETETDAFAHVAVASDMDEFPASKAEAQLEGSPYYRGPVATVDYTTVTTAQTAAAYTKQRIAQLATEYAAVREEFAGSETNTYVGGS